MAGQNSCAENKQDSTSPAKTTPSTRRSSYTPHSRSTTPSRRSSLTQGFRELGRSVSIKLQPRQRKVSRKEKGSPPSPPSCDRGYGSKGSSAENITQEDLLMPTLPPLPPTPERSILKNQNSTVKKDQMVRVVEARPEVIGDDGGVEWYHRGLGPDMRCNSISDYLDFVSLEASASPNSDDIQWVSSPLRRVSSYERFRRAYGEYVDLIPPASEAPTNGRKYQWISLKRAIWKKK